MKYLFAALLMSLGLGACTPAVQRHPANSFEKDFSPLLYPMGHSIPAQWEGKDWDPALWPLSYQNKDNFTKGLFDADIIRDQYLMEQSYFSADRYNYSPDYIEYNDRDTQANRDRAHKGRYVSKAVIPVLVVGPNFYHLSDHDQIRLCDTINMLYGATSGSYGAFLLTDWHSKKVIGEYSKGGLSLR